MSVSDLRLLEGRDYTISTFGRDGGRFVGLFRRCWDAIPEADRQTMLDYWDRREEGRPASFELSNLWRDSDRCYAQVEKLSRGYRLLFNADSFSVMPERPALFIIAHELAHVHGWASGHSAARFKAIYEAHAEEAVVLAKFEAENEARADALAEHWGFDKSSRNQFKLLADMMGFEAACKGMTS